MTGEQHCPGCRGFTRDWELDCAGLALEAVLMAYARHPDGRDRPASLVSDFIATLIARTENPGLLWREFTGGKPGGPYWQDWYCEPPGYNAGFRVLPGREEWVTEAEDSYPVRRIYAIEVLDAAAEATAGADRRAGPGGVRPADGTRARAAAACGTAPEATPSQERPDGAGAG